jgi:hypothetical protein
MMIDGKHHPDIPKDPDTTKSVTSGGICAIDRQYVMVRVGSGTTDAVDLFSESGGFVCFFLHNYHVITDRVKRAGETRRIKSFGSLPSG